MARMNELFPEFYWDSLEVNDLKREQNNLIVFDSNFLLDILRLPTDIAEKYLEAIERVNAHIFIPYLVGIEFNFHKKKVKIETLENVNLYKKKISDSLCEQTQKIYDNLCESLLDSDNVNFLKNKTHKQDIYDKTKEKLESFHNNLLEEKNRIVSDLHKTIDDEYSKDLDELTIRIIDLIGNSVATKREQEWFEKVQEKGSIRYDKEIPPGFNDRKDKADEIRTYSNISYDTQYGDYIVWEEILHEVASKGKDLGEKVIFVTSDGNSDKKYDLMYRVKGKTVGPYISMLNELYELEEGYSIEKENSSGVKLYKKLHIVDGFRFMTLANDLNDDQAKLYEPDKSNLGSSSDIDAFIDDKQLLKSQLERSKLIVERKWVRSNIMKLQEELINADPEKEEILKFKINMSKRKLRRLNRRIHMSDRETDNSLFNDEVELGRRYSRSTNGTIGVPLDLDDNSELEELVREYRFLEQSIFSLGNRIQESTDDGEIQRLILRRREYIIKSKILRRKIENIEAGNSIDNSDDELF